MEGEAACKWKVGSGRGASTNYHGEEKCLDSVSYLFGSKEGESIEVHPGVYAYNFECQLSSSIPQSAEGEHGHVRYRVDANLDIPWAPDLHDERVLTVIRYEDLNFFPELRMPCAFEEIKIFCCWFCKSEPLILRVGLLKTGFALGEKVPILVEMINRSSKDISHTTFTLNRVDTFNCQQPFETKKVVKQEIVKSQSQGVKAGETVSFKEFLEIPPVCVISNNRYCKVFQITYEVKVTAETEGCSSSPKVLMPITVGMVELQND